MLPIPEVTAVDLAFGSISHMPKYEDVPKEFKSWNNKYSEFIEKWFFTGKDATILKPRPGVDEQKALKAIAAILGSFAPKHEHKIAACAYLLSEWFELD